MQKFVARKFLCRATSFRQRKFIYTSRWEETIIIKLSLIFLEFKLYVNVSSLFYHLSCFIFIRCLKNGLKNRGFQSGKASKQISSKYNILKHVLKSLLRTGWSFIKGWSKLFTKIHYSPREKLARTVTSKILV